MTTAELLKILEQHGEKLVLEGDRLVIVPGKVDEDLFTVIREKREELKALLRRKEDTNNSPTAKSEGIRGLFPAFGYWATTADGWTGEVWGISPHGLMVRGLHNLVYTVDLSEVVSVTEEKPKPSRSSISRAG